jgi:hypothetical protein
VLARRWRSVWTRLRWWRNPSAVLHLAVGPSVVRAAIGQPSAPAWAAECPWDSETDLVDVIARLASGLPQPARHMTVTLERPLVQLRTIRDLPPVRARVLPALVASQDRRFFRRNGRPLVTAAAWVRDQGARVARAAAVDEPVVEAIAAGARAAGLAVADVRPANDPAPLSLVPAAERDARAHGTRRRVVRLAIATATAWVAAAGLFAGKLRWERRAIEAALVAVEAPLAALRSARAEVRRVDAAVAAMREAERRRGRALATLDAITRALPDSVALSSLVWTGDGEGTLGGVGPRAAEVVTALRRAQAVPGPSLVGQVTRETVAGREWERFTIRYGHPAAGAPARAEP